MQAIHVVKDCPVAKSFRVEQAAGMFDLQIEKKSRFEIAAELPDLTEEWQVGAIVGPSGSGKSTLATAAWGKQLTTGYRWPKDASILDGFPADTPIRDITRALTAVGFSSPPRSGRTN